MQCKERIDLLEALKQSRLESKADDEGDSAAGASANGKLSKVSTQTSRQSSDSDSVEKGWIGGGTIPAMNYPDLSRPGPPLPQRPTILSKNSSERVVVGKSASSPSTMPNSSRTTSMTSSTLAPQTKKTSRSPSPDKGRTMLTTLRSGKGEKKTTMRSPPISGSSKFDRPVPSKAATLAWNSVGRSGRDGLGRSRDAEFNSSTTTLDSLRRTSFDRPKSSNLDVRYDSTTRTLVNEQPKAESPLNLLTGHVEYLDINGRKTSYPFPPTDHGKPEAVAGSMLKPSAVPDLIDLDPPMALSDSEPTKTKKHRNPPHVLPHADSNFEPLPYPSYLKEYPESSAKKSNSESQNSLPIRRRSPARAQARGDTKPPSSMVSRKPVANSSSPRHRDRHMDRDEPRKAQRREARKSKNEDTSSLSVDDDAYGSEGHAPRSRSSKEAAEAKRRPNTSWSNHAYVR